MKPAIHFLIPLLFLTLCVVQATQAQDSTEKEAKKVKKAAKSPEVKSVLDDPRYRNVWRTIKKDPKKAAESIMENPDEAVRSATALFQKKLQEKGTSVEELKGKVIEKLSTSETPIQATPVPKTEMPAIRRPVVAATRKLTPPATRSAVATAKSASPISQDAVGGLAPNGGIVETATPAQAIEPGFSPMLVMAGNVPLQLPDSSTLSGNTIPSPKVLKPRYAAAQKSSTTTNHEAMMITARGSVMDKKNRIITFTGDVYARSDVDRITMECDKLQIFLTKEGANVKDVDGKPTQITKIVATGGTVKIRKVTPKGIVQTAIARRIDYSGITKDAILSGGPPSLQDGGKSVKPQSEDSKIILRGNGKHEVTGSGRQYFSVPIKNGKKLSKDLDAPRSSPLN